MAAHLNTFIIDIQDNTEVDFFNCLTDQIVESFSCYFSALYLSLYRTAIPHLGRAYLAGTLSTSDTSPSRPAV